MGTHDAAGEVRAGRDRYRSDHHKLAAQLRSIKWTSIPRGRIKIEWRDPGTRLWLRPTRFWLDKRGLRQMSPLTVPCPQFTGQRGHHGRARMPVGLRAG